MAPDFLNPAPLDDCMAVFRTLLRERGASEIDFNGRSAGGRRQAAGGRLAAALILRKHDKGLPLPVGLILATLETDLTEPGESVRTNRGVEPG